MTDIKLILDQIAEFNINKCCYTTYDQGVGECVRREIIAKLAEAHGIKYHYVTPTVKDFPVKTIRNR